MIIYLQEEEYQVCLWGIYVDAELSSNRIKNERK